MGSGLGAASSRACPSCLRFSRPLILRLCSFTSWLLPAVRLLPVAFAALECTFSAAFFVRCYLLVARSLRLGRLPGATLHR